MSNLDDFGVINDSFKFFKILFIESIYNKYRLKKYVPKISRK